MTVACVHYGRKPSGAFDHLPNPTAADLSQLYWPAVGDVVAFGHDHIERDVTVADRRFLNPGSVGCHDRAEAGALLLHLTHDGLSAEKIAAPYDDSALIPDFEDRQVPERDFILKAFIRRP